MCSLLDVRKGFAEYVALLHNASGLDLDLVKTCKSDVCVALWGGGNPDITGVGVCKAVSSGLL